MSASNGGIMSNLKNKINYNVNNLVYDENANEYVKKQQQAKEEKVKEEENRRLEEQKKKDEEEKIKEENTNIFIRFLKKVIPAFTNTLSLVFIPFLALVISMLVVNDMIIYSSPVRIIFFIFTFFSMLYIPLYAFLIFGVYIIRALYALYNNRLTDSLIRKKYFPTVFNLFPIISYNPNTETNIPLISYVKTEKSVDKIINILQDYINSLKHSFKGFDEFNNLYNGKLNKIIEGFVKEYKLDKKMNTEKLNELLHF